MNDSGGAVAQWQDEISVIDECLSEENLPSRRGSLTNSQRGSRSDSRRGSRSDSSHLTASSQIRLDPADWIEDPNSFPHFEMSSASESSTIPLGRGHHFSSG